MDADLTCCATGIVDAAGSCCPDGSVLDGSGNCCADGKLDPCGVCGGSGVAVDLQGSCCTTLLDAQGLCCEVGGAEECRADGLGMQAQARAGIYLSTVI